MFYCPEIESLLMQSPWKWRREGKRHVGRFCSIMTHLAGICVLVPSSVPGVNFTSCYRESCFGILVLGPKRKIMLSVCGKKEKKKRKVEMLMYEWCVGCFVRLIFLQPVKGTIRSCFTGMTRGWKGNTERKSSTIQESEKYFLLALSIQWIFFFSIEY